MKINQEYWWRNIFLVVSIFLFFGVFALLFANQPAPVQETDSSQRIISLGPAITEELYLLGVEDKLVGVTTYCQRPQQALQKEKIGTVTKVNIEKIVGLKPDLVIATSLIDLNAIKKLENLGINVVTFPQAENFNYLCEQFLELGKIVSKKQETEKIIETVKNEVNHIKKKVKNLPEVKVFIQIGADPLFTVTDDSFINDFIKFAGGVNIVRDSGVGLYSREKVLEANPDVIIIVTMGVAGTKEKQIWQKFKTLKAVKNNRIYIIDSDIICSPTPVTFVKGLKDIATILHSNLDLE